MSAPDVDVLLAPGQYLRVLATALEGLQQRWAGSIPSHAELRAEIEALALLAYQGHYALNAGTGKPEAVR